MQRLIGHLRGCHVREAEIKFVAAAAAAAAAVVAAARTEVGNSDKILKIFI